jgi:hypothetical protein
MSNRTTSLARPLTFSDVLPIWELWADDEIPRSDACPLCRGRVWRVYQDRRVGGDWAYCFDCRRGGDPIQWSARVFQTDIWGTLQILEETGGTRWPLGSRDAKAAGRYMRDHVSYGPRFKRLWQESLRDLPYHEPDSFTRMQAEVLRTSDPGLRDLVSVVGASTAKKVETLFHPRSMRPQLRLTRGGQRTLRQGSGAGRSRIFHGRIWNKVLLFPCEDLPGRISGFYIMRDAMPAEIPERLFRAVPHAPGNPRKREAGLSMLSLALSRGNHPTFGNSLFVVYDPVAAARLQLLHLICFNPPLPIVGAYADDRAESDEVFATLKGKRLVFWTLDASMRRACLLRCCRLRGRFSDLADPRARREGAPPPFYVLRELLRDAVSWEDALKREMRRGSADEGVALLKELNLPAEAHNKLLRDWPDGLLDRLKTAENPWPVYPRYDFSQGLTVCQGPFGWYELASGRCLLNVCLKVEQERHFSDGRAELLGRARWDEDRSHEFSVSRTQASQQGLIATVIASLPEPFRSDVQYDASLNGSSLHIAKCFHPPVVHERVDSVGVRPGNQLHLRNFSIRMGGRVEVALDELIPPDAPAAKFQPPQPLRKEAIARFSRYSRESLIFWTVAAAVAYDVIAPLFRWEPRPIGLVGAGTELIGRTAALLLGCREVELPQPCTPATFVRLLKEEHRRHAWPCFASLTGRVRPSAFQQLLTPSTVLNNCIVPLPEHALNAEYHRHWIIIRSTVQSGDLKHLEHHAHRILPLYIQDVMRRHGNFAFSDPDRFRMIHRDLADWFRRQKGDPETVLRPGHLLQFAKP